MINGGETFAVQNVTYCDLDLTFLCGDKYSYRSYLPNLYNSSELFSLGKDPDSYRLKTIGLVTTREVRDEELFSCYDFVAKVNE